MGYTCLVIRLFAASVLDSLVVAVVSLVSGGASFFSVPCSLAACFVT
jgi:hypothetical protein